MGDGTAVLATALLLLLASPCLGVGTLLALRRAGLPSLRQLLLTNLVLTAITATVLMGLSVFVERQSENEWRETSLRFAVWTIPSALTGESAKPWWTVTLSVAVDRMNRGPLCWLAWGALAAGLITTGKGPESAGRYAWLLGLEAAWLGTYAAGDGVTFIGASLLTGLCVAMLTALWGQEDRRNAAARLWRWWLVADGLLLLGLLGLANAAVWSQQHVTSVLPSLSMTWETLAHELPRTAMHNQSAAQYWSTSSGWWFIPLVAAAAIRSGLPPFHSAMVNWWGQVSAPVGVMTLVGSAPLGVFLWMRVIGPTFATEVREHTALFAAWGALATLGAGMLCLAQTEVRRFAAYFSLTGASLSWFALSSGQPGTIAGAWDSSVTFALGSAAVLALVISLDERWPSRNSGWGGLWTTAPLWSAALLVTIGGLIGFPAATRWRPDWLTGWSLAGARPGPFFVAVFGWFIASWASVWMLQRWLWGTVMNPSQRPHSNEPRSASIFYSIDDLRRSEVIAILVLLILLGLVSTGWMTSGFESVPVRSASDAHPIRPLASSSQTSHIPPSGDVNGSSSIQRVLPRWQVGTPVSGAPGWDGGGHHRSGDIPS